MAQFSDLLGRVTKIEGDTGEVREILAQMLSSPVAAPTISNDEEKERTDKTKQIQEDIKRLADDFEEYKDDSEKWVKDVVSAYKKQADRIVKSAVQKSPTISKGGIQRAMEHALRSIMGKMTDRGSEKKGVGDLVKSLKKQEQVYMPLRRLAEAGLKPGSIEVHDRDGNKFLDGILHSLKKGSGAGGGGRAGGGVDLGGVEENARNQMKVYTTTIDQIEKDWLEDRQKRYRKWAGQIGSATSMILGGYNLSQHLGIEPQAIATQIKYMQNIRAIAFQTEGITAETKELQKKWEQFGKTAAQTGQSAATFEEQLVNNLRRGVKSREDAIKITKTGLQLSTMIGSNAQETASLLNEWNMTMDLSSNEMADLSRGIQDVARWTGVTGDKLMQAVKSSEQFVKQMRNAGTATASSAKNMVMMQAMAQKLGVEDTMKDLQEGLASNAQLLFRSSKETKNVLMDAAARSGMMREAINGTIMDTRKGMEGIAQGMAERFQGITGFDIKDIDEMPQDLRSRMNLVFESAFGMGVKEYAKAAEVMREGGKGFAERMSDIDKELEQHLTTEERRALVIKKGQLTLSAGLEQATKFAKVAKATDSVTEAVNKLRKQTGPAWEDMMSDLLDLTKQFGMEDLTIGIQAGDPKTIAKAMGLSAAKALKDAGGEDYQKEMLAAIEANDMSKIREIQEKMTDQQQKLGVETATGLDPVTDAVQALNLINEAIRKVVSGLLKEILDAIGPYGIILTAIAGTLAGSALLGPEAGIIGGILSKLGFRRLLGKAIEGIGRLKNSVAVGVANGMKRIFSRATSGAAATATGSTVGTSVGQAATKVGPKIGRGAAKVGEMGRGVGQAATKVAPKIGRGVAKVGGRALASVGGRAAAAGGTAALGAGTGGTALLIMGAIGGVVGAFRAGAKAAEIFKVKQEELTRSQQMAAEGAGFLTGSLDFLTFGIFSKWIGPTGSITKAIAKFLDKFTILALAIQTAIIPFKVLWGIIKGLYRFLKESFIGLWEGIKLALAPVGEALGEVYEVFQGIFKTFNETLNAILGVSNTLSSEGSAAFSVVESLASTIGFLGKVVGFVFKIIGKTIGIYLKAFLLPLVKVIKILGVGIKKVIVSSIWPFVKAFQLIEDAIKKVRDSFAWLWDKISGIGSWIRDGIKVGIAGLGEWLWESLTGGKAGYLGGWLWDTLTGGNAGIGRWLRDTLKTPLRELVDWVLSFIPGYKWFSGSKEESVQTKEKKGSSFIHGPGGGMGSIAKGNFGKSDLDLFDDRLKDRRSPSYTMNTEIRPMAINRSEPVVAESAPMTDVHDRVAQEQAGAEAGATNIGSDELVLIASFSQEQVALLRRLVELQEQIGKAFGDGAKKSGLSEEQKKAITRSTTKAVDTPEFYRWQYGQYGENASKDLVVTQT